MRNRILLNQKRLCVDLVHEDEWKLDGTVRILSHGQPLRAGFAERTLATSSTIIKNLRRMQTMPRVKQASKQKRTIKAVTVLGATGLGFSLLGNASASTMPAAEIAQSDNIPPNQRFVLSEEEMADVSLATFHLFDKEQVGGDVQLAAVVVRGCRGCGGCRGCRGCAVRGCAVRACAVGCAVRACAVGCAVGCAAGSCCASWGYCRVC
jgi:hypothetical protein